MKNHISIPVRLGSGHCGAVYLSKPADLTSPTKVLTAYHVAGSKYRGMSLGAPFDKEAMVAITAGRYSSFEAEAKHIDEPCKCRNQPGDTTMYTSLYAADEELCSLFVQKPEDKMSIDFRPEMVDVFKKEYLRKEQPVLDQDDLKTYEAICGMVCAAVLKDDQDSGFTWKQSSPLTYLANVEKNTASGRGLDRDGDHVYCVRCAYGKDKKCFDPLNSSNNRFEEFMADYAKFMEEVDPDLDFVIAEAAPKKEVIKTSKDKPRLVLCISCFSQMATYELTGSLCDYAHGNPILSVGLNPHRS